MAYDGSLPYSVGEQLGDVLYSDARAGVYGETYYISMKNTNNEWSLFAYNTEKNIWYRQDNLQALGFGTVSDELFAIDEVHNTLVEINGTMGAEGWTQEGDFSWKAEFGVSGIEYTPNTSGGMSRADLAAYQYVSRFDIRMYMEEGSKAELEIMYDSNGEWTKQGVIRGNRMKSFVLPVTSSARMSPELT